MAREIFRRIGKTWTVVLMDVGPWKLSWSRGEYYGGEMISWSVWVGPFLLILQHHADLEAAARKAFVADVTAHMNGGGEE